MVYINVPSLLVFVVAFALFQCDCDEVHSIFHVVFTVMDNINLFLSFPKDYFSWHNIHWRSN